MECLGDVNVRSAQTLTRESRINHSVEPNRPGTRSTHRAQGPLCGSSSVSYASHPPTRQIRRGSMKFIRLALNCRHLFRPNPPSITLGAAIFWRPSFSCLPAFSQRGRPRIFRRLFLFAGPVRRDNQDENPATIRMRMRRCWGDEGRA